MQTQKMILLKTIFSVSGFLMCLLFLFKKLIQFKIFFYFMIYQIDFNFVYYKTLEI